ncbi:MAG: cysteine desulfurase [Deltaproteobacteria bacterium]|nr:cysteine desulfurase [Deltaproteobacteria bacterium]
MSQWRAYASRLSLSDVNRRGAPPAGIVFTSGRTESNNLSLLGRAPILTRRSIITTAIEHASVRLPIERMVEDGWTLRTLPVDGGGLVALDEFRCVLDDQIGMVSVAWANNEIGALQPVWEMAQVCRSRGVRFHSDAAQAVGKIPVRIDGIDLLSMSAHKIGGPQGVGALFVGRDIELRPLQLGGGQERGRRAGTENVAAIVGMGEACRLARIELAACGEAWVAMRDRLWARLQAVGGVRCNGPLAGPSLPNTLNVSFAGVRGEALVAGLDLEGVAASSGSACAAGAGEPSHVLLALGRSQDEARDGVRFSFGVTNSLRDVERIAEATAKVVGRIRATHRGVG